MKRKEPEAQKKKYYPILYPHPEFCYVCGVLAENTSILPSGTCDPCFARIYGEKPDWMRMCGNGKKNGHKKG